MRSPFSGTALHRWCRGLPVAKPLACFNSPESTQPPIIADEALCETITILGGTGFVGRALIESWPVERRAQLRLIVHRSQPDWIQTSGVAVQRVDLTRRADVEEALKGSGTVINLLRPTGDGWLSETIRAIAPLFAAAGVRRLIHCSSIDVYGNIEDDCVDESTAAAPATPYEVEHIATERILQDLPLQVNILRLGAVFGPGGRNIVAIAKEVSEAPAWKLAARRALYGHRRMHLVSVETVTDVIRSLASAPSFFPMPRLIVTEDAAPENNFSFLQDALIRQFSRPSLVWVPELPKPFLDVVLRSKGKAVALATRRFSSTGLNRLKIDPTHQFASRLQRYLEFLKREASQGQL